ncbi:MAG: hypothetical protein GYA55_07520 [SAR324 cluster bacterium]|uniref:Fibronectin type-III domain-containing protein n=1 Tax=SAR324 cluster bacterium TaxID=2024889 RepID=A0A7X9FRJ3_9DELT|nr:hypothetical protein [SAR324 cluster bacterium]
MLRVSIVLILSSLILSCGRYGPPRPPEVFAPKAVSELLVTPASDKLTFQWKSPEKDLRDKELKSLDGYYVMRASEKDVKNSSELEKSLVKIGEVDDPNVKERDKLRKEAREKGEISRRVHIPSEKKIFTFEDKDLNVGETYLYRIIPFNQGDEKGKASSIVKVLFKGEQSDIMMLEDEQALDEGVPESPFGADEDKTAEGGLLKINQ